MFLFRVHRVVPGGWVRQCHVIRATGLVAARSFLQRLSPMADATHDAPPPYSAQSLRAHVKTNTAGRAKAALLTRIDDAKIAGAIDALVERAKQAIDETINLATLNDREAWDADCPMDTVALAGCSRDFIRFALEHKFPGCKVFVGASSVRICWD